MIRRSLLLSFLFIAFLLSGCDEYGTVFQGVVVSFERDNNQLYVLEATEDAHRPVDDTAFAHTFTLDTATREQGAVLRAGRCVSISLQDEEALLYDVASQNFQRIPFTLIRKEETHSFGAAPIIDKNARTVTVASWQHKALLTLQLSAEASIPLAVEDWTTADFVRIYHKNDGKALRIMPVAYVIGRMTN